MMEIRYDIHQKPIGVFATRYFRRNEPLIFVEYTKIHTSKTATSTQVSATEFIETESVIVKYMRTSQYPNLGLERQFFTPISGIRPGDEFTFRFADTKLH